MKKLSLFLFLVMITSGSIFCQTNNVTSDFCKSLGPNTIKPIIMTSAEVLKKSITSSEQETPGSSLREMGIVVTLLGLVMIGAGTTLYIESANLDNDFASSLQKEVGLILILHSAIATGGGIAMIVVGQFQLNRSSARIRLNLTPVSTNFTYRF